MLQRKIFPELPGSYLSTWCPTVSKYFSVFLTNKHALHNQIMTRIGKSIFVMLLPFNLQIPFKCTNYSNDIFNRIQNSVSYLVVTSDSLSPKLNLKSHWGAWLYQRLFCILSPNLGLVFSHDYTPVTHFGRNII